MKSLFYCIALLLILSSPASAQDQQGFIGPGTDTNMVKVSELGSLEDYTQVMLNGYVQKKLDDRDLYQFSDGTGTVVLSVDDDLWTGLTVTPDDLLEVQGELHKSSGQLEVEVSMVAKIQRQVIETVQPGAVVK